MDKLEQKIQEFAESLRKSAIEALFDVEAEVLPYIEHDTVCNAAIQAEGIVRNILEGRFDWDGDYIVINGMRELTPKIRIHFSHGNYDHLRDRIIERMPNCPKDAKIKALEEELRLVYERRIY